jgi:GGDEF domain-containing protein
VSHSDEALDTAAAFLRSLADHALSDDLDQQADVRGTSMAWMRHLTVGAPHPDDEKESDKRDFAGARRFVQKTMREGHAVHMRTSQQFRDTVWGFASQLHAIVANDVDEDRMLDESLNVLKSATEMGSVEDLRKATSSISRTLFAVMEQRRDRHEKNALAAAERLPELLEMLQRHEGSQLDPATGVLDQRALFAAAEKVHVLSSLARAPVSIVSVSLGDQGLKGQALDDVMAAVAPAVSRAFLCRTDIVGRESDDTFAVVCAGCDLATAERSAQRAKLAVQKASADHAKQLGLTSLAPKGGIAPLSAPVAQAFLKARGK